MDTFEISFSPMALNDIREAVQYYEGLKRGRR